jgi:hypothetical protein
MNAYILATSGEFTVISPANGTDFSLLECQNAVGGRIEIVDLRDGRIMIINEEGKFMCQLNINATLIALDRCALFPGDYICGDVIICGTDMLR